MHKRLDFTDTTRKNWIAAYWRCLARNKGGAMTAKEAALTAGYHRSTFYAYFDSAADLADAAEEDLLDEALSTLFSCCGTALRARFLRQDAASFAAKLRAILLPLARMAGPKDADGMGRWTFSAVSSSARTL